MISVVDAQNLSKVVEKQFGVDQFQLDEINCWPLVKFIFYGILAQERKRKYNQFARKGSHSNPIEVLSGNSIRRFKRSTKRTNFGSLSIYSPKGHTLSVEYDFLFIELYVDYRRQHGNKLIDQYLDPLLWVAKKNYSAIKLCHLEYSCSQKEFYYPPHFYINSQIPHLQMRGDKSDFFSTLQELKAFVIAKDSRFDFDIITEFKRIVSVFEKAKALIPFLSHVNPKAIFLQSFPNSEKASWLVAGKNVSIPVVDLQHGYLDSHQVFSSYSSRISPAASQISFPDCIGAWGQETKSALSLGHPQPALGQVEICGYLWPAMKEQLGMPPPSCEPAPSTAPKRVLIIHQPDLFIQYSGSGGQLPEFLFNAIKKSGNTVNWVFRLHPRSRHLADDYLRFFKKSGINNLSIEQPTDISIEYSISKAETVLTSWSTVAFEANQLGKKVGIIDEVGKQVFGKYILAGCFAYTSNEKELSRLLEIPDSPPKIPYFSPNPKETALAFLERFAPPSVKLIQTQKGIFNRLFFNRLT